MKISYITLLPTLLIALLIIYFVGRSTGRARANKKAATPPIVDYPHGGKGIPKGFDPEILADKLFLKMKGLTFDKPGLDGLLLQLVSLQTDDMFVAVYDVFNQKYHSAKRGGLRQWIERQDYGFPIRFPDLIRPYVYQRMDNLNLY